MGVRHFVLYYIYRSLILIGVFVPYARLLVLFEHVAAIGGPPNSPYTGGTFFVEFILHVACICGWYFSVVEATHIPQAARVSS